MPLKLVGIGASTGGPEALSELLAALPESFATPIVIAQHLPRGFSSDLAYNLSSRGGYRVQLAEDQAPIEERVALLGPPDHDIYVSRRDDMWRVELREVTNTERPRPGVNALFSSLAHHAGADTAVILLSGMGRDGVDGARRVAEAGGRVLLQDAVSSAVWGMAGAAESEGITDICLPPRSLAAELALLARWRTYSSPGSGVGSGSARSRAR